MRHPWISYVAVVVGLVLIVVSVAIIGAAAAGWDPEISFGPSEPECALLSGEC